VFICGFYPAVVVNETAAPKADLTESLSATLRRGAELLAPLAKGVAAARALDRLERDLLPRAAEGSPYLVAGIVGPNNAGKSALFNALVGAPLSPSVPTGGATRRLIGATHPDLLARLQNEPTLARFRLRVVGDRERLAAEAVQTATDPAELLVVAERSLPAALMLIDTPDFDSILGGNRLASESLLAVADLVVVIVTRHTYQNRDVVRFLEGWLAHGRPWMLVYNESIDAEVARNHTAKLAHDVGTPPLALFWAPHSVAIQQGTAALEPRRLGGDGLSAVAELGSSPAPGGTRLRDLLFHLESIAEIKTRAFSASMAQLRHDVDALAGELRADTRMARDVLAAAAARARQAGLDVAASAMPIGPFVEAFRVVLDRRSNPVSRSWRLFLRQLRVGLERLPRVFLRPSHARDSGTAAALVEIEQRHLRQHWAGFWEDLVRDLGTGGRHPARGACGETAARWLEADLRPERGREALSLAERRIAGTAPDLDRFREKCEALIHAAIEQRGFDFDIQAAADVATLAPLALAAAVIVKTGGLGSDLAAAGGGAVSTFLMEKYMHLLGSSLTTQARERWTELRGTQLAEVLVEAALQQSAPLLRKLMERNERIAGQLLAWAGALTRSA
jgi:hypothetical protein